MNKQIFLLLLCMHCIILSNAQQTVGLFTNDSLAFDGYTLFSPSNATSTYLIDNCGREVNSWQHGQSPGLAAYFLEDGTLIRAARIPSSFNGGGTGGKLEKYDWNGNIVWEYIYSTGDYHQHHDFEVLPNGNILVLAWDLIPDSLAIAYGKDSLTLILGLWGEKVVELQPIGSDSAVVVWEWRLIDHVVQDHDSTKANYGVIADHPERVDINFTNGQFGNPDWIHANALDYNPTLDQIIISNRNFNEFWIIDHSTSTAQAASSSGGNSGKGGDILYRWGNPVTYDRGTNSDKKLFSQHDVHWIEPGLPDEGKIMVFNNGVGRPGGPPYSTVDIIDPVIDSLGNYPVPTTNAFGPTNAFWTYTATVPTDFYSSFISGATQLPNGNVLICEGAKGKFFEIDQSGNIHWEYINPVNFGGPIAQGSNPNLNDVFRCYRYSPSYPGFNGLNLTPGLPIEINPLPSNCLIFTENFEITNEYSIDIHMNALNGQINVINEEEERLQLEIYDLHSHLIQTADIFPNASNHFLLNSSSGIYICQVKDTEGHLIAIKKLIKL